MKIVIIGGSGLIGKKLLSNLRRLGHDVVSASPSSGVNAVTGEGLSEAMSDAQVVVDVSNSPSFADQAVLEFFEKSSRNLLAAEAIAGVKHHVALSVVGAERLPDSGYMRAKIAQEKLIKESGIPYTILRATQFFEFLEAIAGSGVVGDEIRLPPALMQPVAATDVANALTDFVISGPKNGTLELAGPEARGIDECVRRYLNAKHDPRPVTTDKDARYFGAAVNDRSITPSTKPLIGATSFEKWFSELAAQK